MSLLIGTAGHVDHGKTTLIKALTGIDADRLPEEKLRGMTIDVGFAFLDFPKLGRVGIVDVPGHERFIKNMLAGASGVDVALLCVDANESVKPQTIEHFQILKLLEAKAIIVALTKIDIADNVTIETSISEVRELLHGSKYDRSEVIPVSAQTGEGLENLTNAIETTLLEIGEPEKSDLWFMPIDRVFSLSGHGTIVTGTMAMGQVNRNDIAELMPGKIEVRIRSVQSHGEDVTAVERGQRCAMNVVGIKKEEIHRGQAIGAPNCLNETVCLNSKIVLIEEIRHGERVRVHIGADETIGKLFLFDKDPELVQLRLETPVACAKGQRLVIRKYSPPILLGGGEIITPIATPQKKHELPNAKTTGSIFDLIANNEHGTTTEQICQSLGQTPQQIGNEIENLKENNKVMGFAGNWLTPESLENLTTLIRKSLLEIHAKNPDSLYVSKLELSKYLPSIWTGKPLDRLLNKLTIDKKINAKDANIRHPDHSINLNEKQKLLLEKVIKAMDAAGALSPTIESLAGEVGAPIPAIEEIIRLGLESGHLQKIPDNLIYPKITLDKLSEAVKILAPKFTVAQFRDATNSSRKFALPLLQYFDEIHLTRRVGEERIVLNDTIRE